MREELQAILYAPHHVSKTHPHMSRMGRATKFSSFKAIPHKFKDGIAS